MRELRLGTQGPPVSVIGLGCLGLTSRYGAPDRGEALATFERAIELGVTLFDTSDAYGAGQNESFVGEVISGRRDGLVISTKFGNVRGPNGELGGTNGRPDYVHVACNASLRRLGIEWIDLYYQHRVDPDVPIEETVGAMARLVEEGKVRHLGLCEAGPETILRAHAVHPITAVQMEYSLWSRDAEAAILPLTRELGISLVAYSPLGQGFLTGALRSRDVLNASDLRQIHPRFQAGHFERNLELLDPLERLARAKGCTPGQIALAWVLVRGNDIVPIPGTARRTHLEENLGAANLEFTDDELRALDAAFPPDVASGPRYPEHLLEKLCI
jgi:aryl-alcohol dehydrogenase-like predicted oxidoreductase